MLAYPIKLTPDDNGTVLVTCPLLPMVVTFGDDEALARLHAADAIETALGSMIDDGDEIPVPPSDDPAAVRLPTLTAIKVELYRALRAADMTRAELARRLGWRRESVDRLFRLDHRSRLEQLEAALHVLGRRVGVYVEAEAA